MANNKVIVGDEVILDLTADTVTTNALISGITAHDKSGAQITGGLVIQGFHLVNDTPSSVIDGDLYFLI